MNFRLSSRQLPLTRSGSLSLFDGDVFSDWALMAGIILSGFTRVLVDVIVSFCFETDVLSLVASDFGLLLLPRVRLM